MAVNLLTLDVETSPAIAYVWKFWQENISPKQVLEQPRLLSFAAKWLGHKSIIYGEARKPEKEEELLLSLLSLLNDADIVIVQNGRRFDLPVIRARALVHGLPPPSAVKIVDTYEVAKKQFKFPSNSLEYLTHVMGCEVKKKVERKFSGFTLWSECLKGNDAAWKEMKEYNIDDVISLEHLYLKMRPWMTTHPNVAIDMGDETMKCTKCGSDNLQKRGWAHTNSYSYPRFSCNSCGGWCRGRQSIKRDISNMLANEN